MLTVLYVAFVGIQLMRSFSLRSDGNASTNSFCAGRHFLAGDLVILEDGDIHGFFSLN